MKAPRNHRLLFPFLLVTLIQLSSFAQTGDALLTNSQTFEIDAYKDIQGSPYYFAEWQIGKVYPKNLTEKDNKIEDYLLNFNGYSKSFEIRKDHRFIALDEQYYDKIEIQHMEGDQQKTVVFKTNAHPKMNNRFMRIVFKGSNFEVVQDYQVRLSQREKEVYAKKEIVESFTKSPNYYLVKNNKAQSIKLKKKQLLGLFKDQEAAIKKFAKKNRLKLNSEKDLIAILGYYESLTQAKSTLADSGRE